MSALRHSSRNTGNQYGLSREKLTSANRLTGRAQLQSLLAHFSERHVSPALKNGGQPVPSPLTALAWDLFNQNTAHNRQSREMFGKTCIVDVGYVANDGALGLVGAREDCGNLHPGRWNEHFVTAHYRSGSACNEHTAHISLRGALSLYRPSRVATRERTHPPSPSGRERRIIT